MTLRKIAVPFCLVVLAAGCAQKPAVVPAEQPRPAARAPEASVIPAVTIDGYKKAVAARIAANSRHMFSEPLPDMLKSVVVLEITIDRDGNLRHVAVRRSNGFKALEERAVESVREAAPFGAPNALVRHGAGSVNFMETFLFRNDGRFQIRSLVAGA